MKKVFYVLGIIILATVFLAAGIILRNRLGGGAPVQLPGTPEITGGLPSAAPVGVGAPPGTGTSTTTSQTTEATQISDAGTLAFYASPNGDVLYVRPDGQVVRKNSSSSTLISTTKIPDILSASFSFDGRKILIKAGSTDVLRWSVFDVQKNAWRQLTLDARDAYWSPSDYRIAYFARKTSSSALSTLDLANDNSRARSLLTLNAEDLDLAWLGTSYIFLGERGSANMKGEIWRYDMKSGLLTKVRDGVAGARMLWGRTYGLLFTALNRGVGGNLALIDQTGTEIKRFTFITLPSKCTFFTATSSTELLLCAVPSDTRKFGTAALPDAYEQGGLTTTDNFVILNPQSGSYVSVPAAGNADADAEGLQVTQDNVFFLDRQSGQMYSSGLGNYSSLLSPPPRD